MAKFSSKDRGKPTQLSNFDVIFLQASGWQFCICCSLWPKVWKSTSVVTKKRSCMSLGFINNSQTLYTTALLSLSSPSGLFQTASPQFLKAALNRSLPEAFCMRAGFSKDFSLKARHSPLSILPVPLTVRTTHLPCPAAGRSPENQLSVSFRGTWKRKGCCTSQHLWPVATAEAHQCCLCHWVILCLSSGPREAEEAKKWNDLRQPCLDLFCQYWLFHIGFCSGAVAEKVWKDTHKTKLIFSMKAWLCWSCWELWN